MIGVFASLVGQILFLVLKNFRNSGSGFFWKTWSGHSEMKDFRVQDLLKKDGMINLIKNIRKTRVYVVNLLSRRQVSTWFWKTWGFSERLLFPERQFDVFFSNFERLHFDFRKTSFWFQKDFILIRKTSFWCLERLHFVFRKTSFWC